VVCVARRDTTNTPLHALVLLNGEQFVEAARALAERLLVEHGGQIEPALAEAFERLTSRSPDDKERAILGTMISGQLAWYRDQPEEAARYLGVGQRQPAADLPAADVAATAAVINALINYDESVVKR